MKPAFQRLIPTIFIVSLLAAVLGPWAVSLINHQIDQRLQGQISPPNSETPANPPAACIPQVEASIDEVMHRLVIQPQDSSPVSTRVETLYRADQAARTSLVEPDWHEVNLQDQERRVELWGYLSSGEIFTSRDLVYAAFIFQHGDCPEHYQLAHRLAQAALDAGNPDARWIYAATLDRYLMSIGEPQKYGTQYTGPEGKLYPVDPATTDAERAQYNVPPLSAAASRSESASSAPFSSPAPRTWLLSWWLTLIGAAFAALAALSAVTGRQPGAALSRRLLYFAGLVYLISIVGHAAQVASLQQTAQPAPAETAWRVLNGFMILTWMVCGVIVLRRARGK